MPGAIGPRVTLHAVSSLDGFIASKDNSVSWMDSAGDVYERGVLDGGAEVIESIDCYVVGSRTYEHALQLGWPYGDTPTFVITSRELPSTRETVEFYSGDSTGAAAPWSSDRNRPTHRITSEPQRPSPSTLRTTRRTSARRSPAA